MSALLMGYVWQADGLKPSEQSVLLALADHANDDGTEARPGLDLLCWKTGLGRSTVLQALSKLATGQFITKVNGGYRGAICAYLVHPEKGEQKEPLRVQKKGPDPEERVQKTPGKGPKSADERVQNPPRVEKQPSLEPPEPSMEAAIVEIYGYWRQARSKTRASYDRISDQRRTKIRCRLRDGFTVADLEAAIDGVARDPWQDRPLHDDITVIFRCREQVDRFLEMGAVGKPKRDDRPPEERARQWVQTSGWQYSDEDLWEELGRFGLEGTAKSRLVDIALGIQSQNLQGLTA